MFTTLRNTLFVLLVSAGASIAAEENLSRQIDVTSGGKLVVDVDFGSIQVAGAADGKISLETHRLVEFGDETKEKEYLAAAPITFAKEGNVPYGGGQVTHFLPPFTVACDAKLYAAR